MRRRPLRRGTQQVALAAMLQFLALNGWEMDPDPPEPVAAVVADIVHALLIAVALVVLTVAFGGLGESPDCCWRPLLQLGAPHQLSTRAIRGRA